MTAEETIALGARNKQTVTDYHHALWRDGDLTAIERHWRGDAKVRMTDFADTAVTVVREDAERYFGAFEDIETTIEHMIAEGDTVLLHWSTSGTHTGPYGEVAATGKRITMTGMDLLRLEDGLIAECWSMWDGMSVYEQLGVLHIG